MSSSATVTIIFRARGPGQITNTATVTANEPDPCFFKPAWLLAWGGLMLLAPLPAFAGGPDYWVKFSAQGNAIPVLNVPGGKLRRVILVVGNRGAPGRKDPLVSITALSADTGSKVCDVSETIKPPVHKNAVAPLAFQVFYADEKEEGETRHSVNRVEQARWSA